MVDVDSTVHRREIESRSGAAGRNGDTDWNGQDERTGNAATQEDVDR